jgi:hypothetical protein
MKGLIVTVTAILLAGIVTASAAPKGTNGPGASEYTPGDTMQDKGSRARGGASQYTPGHEMKKPGGASELSPGDRMNDKR